MNDTLLTAGHQALMSALFGMTKKRVGLPNVNGTLPAPQVPPAPPILQTPVLGDRG